MVPEINELIVGGAKIGDCSKCGERAQLTESGLCDDCCDADDACQKEPDNGDAEKA